MLTFLILVESRRRSLLGVCVCVCVSFSRRCRHRSSPFGLRVFLVGGMALGTLVFGGPRQRLELLLLLTYHDPPLYTSQLATTTKRHCCPSRRHIRLVGAHLSGGRSFSGSALFSVCLTRLVIQFEFRTLVKELFFLPPAI